MHIFSVYGKGAVELKGFATNLEGYEEKPKKL